MGKQLNGNLPWLPLLNDGGPRSTCTLTIDDFASNHGRSICRLWWLTLLGNLVLEHTSHLTWVVISTWPTKKSWMQSMTIVDWTQHLSLGSCAKVYCPIREDYILSNHCYLCTLAFSMSCFPCRGTVQNTSIIVLNLVHDFWITYEYLRYSLLW